MYADRSNSEGKFSMMWFKKMPNVVLTFEASDFYGGKRTVLTRAFRRGGNLWVKWHGEFVLLKENGSCVGDIPATVVWDEI